MTVSQALAKLLRAYGAEYVFTLTGAPQDPLIEMQNREGVRVVLGRSERSADRRVGSTVTALRMSSLAAVIRAIRSLS